MEKKIYFENAKQLNDIVKAWANICEVASQFISEHARLGLGNVTKAELNKVINLCKKVPPIDRQSRIFKLFEEKYKTIAIKALYLNNIAPALHQNIVKNSIEKDLGQLCVLGSQLQTLCEGQDSEIFNFERVTIDYKEQRVFMSEIEQSKIKEFCTVFIESKKQEHFAALLESASGILNEMNSLSKAGSDIIPDLIYFEDNAFYVNPYALKLVR
jgi:hypothetical protein